MFQNITMFDQNLLLWIQDTLQTPVLTSFFTFLTRLGDAGMIWMLMSVCLLLSKWTRTIGIMALCSLGFAYIIDNVILKNLIGFSRLYLGVHYPTDVLCGALVGTMIAVCVCCIENLIAEWYAKRKGKVYDN